MEKLQEACEKAQQEAEEQGAALHAARLEMQAREQSAHADVAGQKQTLRMLQRDLREGPCQRRPPCSSRQVPSPLQATLLMLPSAA